MNDFWYFGCANNDKGHYLAGWDRTVDTRPGSNAAFISDGDLTLDQMRDRALSIFPEEWKRVTEGEQTFRVVEK